MGRIIFNKGKLNTKPKIKAREKVISINSNDFYSKRSKKYMDVIASLDKDSLTKTGGWDEFLDMVKEEFGTAEILSLPQGIVSKCFLGHPYEVHVLDIAGNHIVEHFKVGQPMDPMFEKARNIALHHIYSLVEIYTDKMILVREDGSTVKYN